jgi:uncharacterized protein (TIGR03118 family)
MRQLQLTRFLCSAALVVTPLAAQVDRNSYVQTNLISDVDGLAAHTDTNLSNAWGIAFGGNGPWWVNSANKDLSLVYDGSGNAFPPGNQLIVSIPGPSQGVPAQPTGIEVNSTSDFGGAIFLFASASGTVSTWNGGTAAVTKISKPGATYLGLTIGQLNGANVLYVANFAGSIEAYDTNFMPVSLPAGAFTDPQLPSGYAPFNVQNIGGSIFVMFAQVGPDGNEVHGAGLGYVDQFAPDGTLQLSLEHGDWMNSPWGIAMAPSTGFGVMSRRILVGQFGGGQVASFNARTGAFGGLMEGTDGNPLVIDGLWGIRFGNNGNAGSAKALYFAAGIQDEAHGLFGNLTFSGR